VIDIDHPSPDPEPEPEAAPSERILTPEPPIIVESDNVAPRSDVVLKNGDEWSSPAFIKRARTSYGSLFDTGYDPFSEEDGTIPGKGRKRSRLSSTWRYVSRSPTPEADRETSHSPSPTPASVPRMTDEGSQTVGFEAGHAAEMLAKFSRQATNVNSTLKNSGMSDLGDDHLLRDARSSGTRQDEMLPPPIQTHFSLYSADSMHQDHMEEEDDPRPPHSPRLKPISSDSLPLVSPFIASTSSPLTYSGDGIGQSAQVHDDQLVEPLDQSPLPHVEDSHGSFFEAARIPQTGEPPIDEFQNFQGPEINMNEIEQSGLDSEFLSKSQYGHWQSVNTPLGHSVSLNDKIEATKNDLRPDGFYVERDQESGKDRQNTEEGHLKGHSFPVSRAEVPSHQPYPGLDDGIHGQWLNAPWALSSSAVTYPELREPQIETKHVLKDIPPSASISTSRAQSAVVDLTESEEDKEEHNAPKGSVDEEMSEGSFEGSVEGVDGPARENALSSPFLSGDEERMEGEDISQDEEGMDDRYAEENDDHVQRFRRDHEADFSEEYDDEESYVEDDLEVDERQDRLSIQKVPVVIDLLSSDDEDDGKVAISTPHPTASPGLQSEGLMEGDVSEEDDEGESDEEMSGEEELGTAREIPYSQKFKLPTITAQENSKETSAAHKDAPFTVDETNGHVEMRTAVSEEFEGVAVDGSNLKVRIEESENVSVEHYAAGELEEISKPEQRLVDDEVSADEDTSQTSIPADQNSSVPDQNQSRRSPSQDMDSSAGKPVPGEQPSLFARMFNLDGANDAHAEVSYPILPKDEVTKTPRPLSSTRPNSQGVAIDQIQPRVPGDIQLLTPDATQLSQIKDSQDSTTVISIDSVLDHAVEPVLEKAKEEVEEGQTGQKMGDHAMETRSAIPPPEGQNGVKQVDNRVGVTEKVPRVSPRRSRRIRKSSGSEAQIAEIMRPSTPDNSRSQEKHGNEQEGIPSPVILDNRSKQEGQDPSVGMALSALESTPEQPHDLRSTSVLDLKLNLSRALRTDLSEFTALKVIRFHLNQKLDVLGIVTSTPAEPQRAKGGPRQYQITFNITDSSIAPSAVTEIQVYRPYIEALPVVKVGDGILLRNFMAIAIKNRGFALRSEQNEASSWAVFKDGAAEPEIRGPPVEYGAAEQSHMSAMKKWYSTLDSTAIAKLNRANGDKGSGVGKG
jgi:hypothetical protein